MPDGIIYCCNLSLSLCFRVGCRSPVTFKTKLCNNSQRQFPAISTNSSILHVTEGLNWILYITSTKIPKGIKENPMIQCNLGKIWKAHSPRYPKNLSRGLFKLGFTPCKIEQPLWGMELQEKKKHKKVEEYRNVC